MFIMKFLKRKSALYIIAVLVILATVISPIVISWGSYMLRTYFKLPVNPNAVTILGGVTGMWGSIFGGLIGGALTFYGVLFTIERERDNNRKVNYQGQLGATVFLLLEIESLINNISVARKSLEGPFLNQMKEQKYRTLSHKFLDKYLDWPPYIEKLHDVNLQQDLWIIYKKFIKIEEDVHRDVSGLHYKKQEILS